MRGGPPSAAAIAGPITLALLLTVGVTPARSAPRLVIHLRDAATSAPAACRLQVIGAEGSIFASPDPALRTHQGGGLIPFVLVEDSLAVEVPVGAYTVRAVTGITGTPVETNVNLTGDTEITLTLPRWIHPEDDGWFSGDPHVHPVHPPSDYPPATPAEVALAARAEGLDVITLLSNDPLHPGGAVAGTYAGVSLLWGEEYRASYWGHVVILGLSELVQSPLGPYCCGLGLPAWPSVQAVIGPASPPLALLAHPHTTDQVAQAEVWPHSGFARELYALMLQGSLHGIAVGSNSNASSRWAVREYRDALAVGAHWCAVGESDMTLDRFTSGTPGWPRTFAQIDQPAPAGSPQLGQQWEDAVRAGRCYASSGPVIQDLSIDRGRMGETITLPAGADVQVHIRAASRQPLTRARLWGVAGAIWAADWAGGRTSVDTLFTISVPGDDALFLELCAPANSWAAPEDTLRAVSSPVWVHTGGPWKIPADVARRGADTLRERWTTARMYKGFGTSQDSSTISDYLLGCAAQYEAMVDDPPGPFALLAPPTGAVLPTPLAALRWRKSRSYDGETTTYRVALDHAPEFSQPTWFDAGPDTTLVLGGLQAGQTYWWRVEASEPGDPAQPNAPPDSWFAINTDPVAAPTAPKSPAVSLSVEAVASDGVVRATLTSSSSRSLHLRWLDVRGRVVRDFPPSWIPAGTHPVTWDGKDGDDRPVAAGVYWLLVEGAGVHQVGRAVLPHR